MENNEKALSMENEVLSQQPADEEEKKPELTDIDKAKALFEYEMTQVLLGFKNEVKKMKAKDVSEYLGMDVPDAGVEYSAPEADVKGIGYTDAHSPEMQEITPQEAQISVNVSVPEASVVDLSFGCEYTVSASVSVPAEKTVGSLAIKGDFEPSSQVSVPEAGKVSVPAVGAAQVKAVTVHKYSDVPAAAVPVPAKVEAGDISVSVPAAEKAQIPALTGVTDVSASVKADVPAAVDADGFVLAAAEVGSVNVSVPDTAVPEIPAVSSPEPKVAEYPAIPPKPDFSAIYSDIIESVRAEL